MRLPVCASAVLFLLVLAACHSAGEDAEVHTFLERYFSTWSAKDMDGYDKCFSDQGRITSIDGQGQAKVEAVTDFTRGQRQARQQGSEATSEKPLDTKVQGDDRVKQAAVTWMRPSGSGEAHGADFFTLQHEGADWKIVSLVDCQTAAPTAGGGSDAEVRTFLEHYFSSWSAQDMDGYGHCFSDQARIFYVDARGQVNVDGVIDFVHGQRLAHQQSSEAMNEKPLDMKIQGDDRIKQAAVTWVLKKGSTEQHGADFFTLQHEASGGWKIVSLVFYGDY